MDDTIDSEFHLALNSKLSALILWIPKEDNSEMYHLIFQKVYLPGKFKVH